MNKPLLDWNNQPIAGLPVLNGKNGRKRKMHDEPLFSPRRLFNAFRLWLYFAAIGESKLGMWQVLRWYRRPMAAAKREVEFL